MYAEVDVLVDGAVDEGPVVFTDSTVLEQWLADVERGALMDGIRAEIHVLWHEHDPGPEECSCAQYVTDGHPYAVYDYRPGLSGSG